MVPYILYHFGTIIPYILNHLGTIIPYIFLTTLALWFLTFFLFNRVIQIVHWRNHLKFPEDTQLSVDAIDLMTRLLCDAEHRAGVEQIKVYF